VFEIHSGSLVLVSSYHPGLAFLQAAATVQGLSVPEAPGPASVLFDLGLQPAETPLWSGGTSILTRSQLTVKCDSVFPDPPVGGSY